MVARPAATSSTRGSLRPGTKQSHRLHDPRQMERLARRGAEGNLRQLGDCEPSEAVLARHAGGGAAHFERVVMGGNGVADLAESRADLGAGEVLKYQETGSG